MSKATPTARVETGYQYVGHCDPTAAGRTSSDRGRIGSADASAAAEGSTRSEVLRTGPGGAPGANPARLPPADPGCDGGAGWSCGVELRAVDDALDRVGVRRTILHLVGEPGMNRPGDGASCATAHCARSPTPRARPGAGQARTRRLEGQTMSHQRTGVGSPCSHTPTAGQRVGLSGGGRRNPPDEVVRTAAS